MKRIMLTLSSLSLLLIAPLRAAEKMASTATSAEKYYGKITSIDQAQKYLTVHNAKQNMDARFQWSERTTVFSDRKTIQPTELKIGQSLVISYVTENDLNKAERINVRHPFKKAAQ